MKKPLASLILISLFASHCAGKIPSRRSGGGDEQNDINRCFRLSAKKHYDEAIECLEIFKSRYPTSHLATEAELRIGDGYFRKKEYLLAAESYQQFIRLHPSHERVDYAYYRLGLAHLSGTPSAVDREQSSLPDAIEAFDIVWKTFPDSAYAKIAKLKADEARTRVGLQNFYVARFYYRTKEYRAAIPRLAAILDYNSGTPLSQDAAHMKLKSHLALGELDQAKTVAGYLQQEFPNDPATAKAIAQLERYEAALSGKSKS